MLYTTSCKRSLVLLRMGEIIAWNMLSWLKLLITLSLLYLVGCLCYYSGAWSHKHQIEGRVYDPLLFVFSSSRRRHYIWVTSFLVMYLPKSLIKHGDQFHDHSFGDLIFDLSSGVLWSIMLTNHRNHCSCESYSDNAHMWILTVYMWSWSITWHFLSNKGFPYEITVILYMCLCIHYFVIETLLVN